MTLGYLSDRSLRSISLSQPVSATRVSWADKTVDCERKNRLEETSTHKSANIHTGTVFVLVTLTFDV